MTGSERIEMLARGSVGSTLLKLSAPAIAGMLVMAIYNVVDTFFVSLLRDTSAVAATGIVFPIFQLIGAIGLTFGMGAASVISRKLGENDHEAADRTAATALYSALAVGIVFSICGFSLRKDYHRRFDFPGKQHDLEQSAPFRGSCHAQQHRTDYRCGTEYSPGSSLHFCL
jgi:Na+-driven multidrug efflux pump